MAPNWHIYWENPGEAGLPPTLEWDLPDGFSVGPFHWPAPERYELQGIMNFVYEGEVLLMFEMTVADDLSAGETIKFQARADWLECDDKVCIPASGDLVLELPVRHDAPAFSPWHEAFEQTRDAWPRQLDEWTAHIYRDGEGHFLLEVRPKEAIDHEPRDVFFFDRDEILAAAAPQTTRRLDNGTLLINLQQSQFHTDRVDRIAGVLTAANGWLPGDKVRAMTIDAEVRPAGEAEALREQAEAVSIPLLPDSPDSALSLLALIGLAFLGGLILNLMPCVFPVLGLKIMGFVKQGGEARGRIVLHGLVFTAGVLISFWVLAGVLIALRASGEQLGWGFQLQSPGFVLALTVILLVFALNMSGVFEIGQSAIGTGSKLTGKSGFEGSFFSGVLATVVATPCAAPFLAPALGAALALPPAKSLLTFTVIAIGLAFPYLLMSIFPGLVAKLPKPGAWMESFKQFMAFLLYATVTALVWVLVGQIGAMNQLITLLSLVMVAMGCWIYGRWAAIHRPRKTRRIACVAAACAIVLPLGYSYQNIRIEHQQRERMAMAQQEGRTDGYLQWQKWSPEKVAQAVDDGSIVYVDFTARWCATCQVNKRVYQSARLIEAFESQQVVTLIADWTNYDPRITEALAEFGRSAIPFNVFYSAHTGDTVTLPELLTVNNVLQALERAVAAGGN